MRGVDLTPSITMYREHLMSCGMIAEQLGVSRTLVHRYLQRAGIDTRKRRLPVVCQVCGRQVNRPKTQVRTRLRHFCCVEHYWEWLHNPAYNAHRQGARRARIVFEAYNGPVSHDWPIHHVDGNQDNNDISNLWAFESQADHMRYHRGGQARALIGTTGEWQVVQATR